MPDDGQLRVRGIAAIGAAIAGIITAGAIGGGDAVVVGLVVFFGLGLAWLVLDAHSARTDRALEARSDDQPPAPIAGSIGDMAADTRRSSNPAQVTAPESRAGCDAGTESDAA